jgi:arylsulfatase A-like enzyme
MGTTLPRRDNPRVPRSVGPALTGALASAALVGVVAAGFGLWRHREPSAPGPVLRRAAADTAVMAFEAPLHLVRFGTPDGEVLQVRGFDRVPLAPRQEPHAALRRQSEVVLRFAQPAARAALLDLDAPTGPDRSARVQLNGHRVGRVDVRPGRRRYAVPLPVERQQPGANRLELIFADRSEGPPTRAFAAAVGEPSALIDALAAAPRPFSVWAEGDDVVQAGPSAAGWAVDAPAEARLAFGTEHVAGGDSRLAVEVERPGGERRRVWDGRAGDEAEVSLADEAGPVTIWLRVDAAGGTPAWARWRDLRVVGDAPPTADPPPAATTRPDLRDASVLVIVLDAAGARHFGCYGEARPTTPEIDRIAAEGTLFERAYTPAVFTRSAMASAWTSQLPDEHHATVSYDDKLPETIPTLAGIAAASGVPTAAFVGNNMAGTAFGLDRGFADFRRASPRAEELTESVLGWLGSSAAAGRYFAYLHYREPHYPFDPRPPFDTMFGPDAPLPASMKTDSRWLDRVNEGSLRPGPEEIAHLVRLYHGNLRLVDREVGRVRRRLEELGRWDRTVVILTADHGEAMYEHGFVGHNEQLYEDSIRIPLIVRLPRDAPRGRRSRMLTGLLDVAPTVADVLGIPADRTATFRGRSLLPVAAGGPDPAAPPVLSRTVGDKPRYALIDTRHKYVFNLRDGDEMLFDLRADPGEAKDVAAFDPVRARYYRQRLFSRLLALPGRAVAGTGGWKVTPQEAEELRALGYVQ